MYKHTYSLDHFKCYLCIGSIDDELSKAQMVPAPPDFSVSPSPSVLLDRVRKALNTEISKPVSRWNVIWQPFDIFKKFFNWPFLLSRMKLMLLYNDFLPQGNNQRVMLRQTTVLPVGEQITINQLQLQGQNQTGVLPVEEQK